MMRPRGKSRSNLNGDRKTIDVDEGIRQLIIKESLDDFSRLLAAREWDEVPLVSRLSRIDFLSSADAATKSRILVSRALTHLDKLYEFRDKHRPGVFIMLSITEWDNLTTEAKENEPVIPCFWISTDPDRDLPSFRMRPGLSRESRMVSDWLEAERLLVDHEVFDPVVSTPDVTRVYVARRNEPLVESVVCR